MIRHFIISFLFISFQFIFPYKAYSENLVLNIGISDNPPLVYMDEQQTPKGLFVELLQYIAEEENWELNYQFGTLTEILEQLQTGEIDIKPDLGYSHQRKQKYIFNDENVISTWAQVYVHHWNDVENLLDLDGLTIAVQEGDYFVDDPYNGFRHIASQMDIDVKIIEVSTYHEVFELIEEKEVDAGIVNRIFGEIHQDEYHVFQTSIVFSAVKLLYAISPENENAEAVKDAIDYHLKRLKNEKDSVFYELLDEYINYQPEVFIPRWVVILIIGIAILLVLFIIFSLTLSIEVRSKKSDLIKERKLVKKIITTSQTGICEISENGEVIFTNSMMVDRFQDKLTEWLPYREIIEGEKNVHNVYCELEKSSGEKLFVLVNGSFFKVREEKSAVFAVEDITELILGKQLRNQLTLQIQQIQKVETIGRIAAGIAHDFNNILMVLQGNIELGLMKMKKGEPADEFMKEIEFTVKRATHLTRQMLVFSRQESKQLEVFDINTLLFEMEGIMNILLGKGITLERDFTNKNVLILANKNNVEQMIINLLTNARDALPNGGKVCLSTKVIQGEEIEDLEPLDYVRLICRDDGVGIKKEVLSLIFDPFFTTKSETEGTGLGLSVIRDIAHGLRGRVDVHSVEHEYTTFYIDLPLLPDKELLISIIRSRYQHIKCEMRKSILIIEGIKKIAELTQLVLNEWGCEVLNVSCVAEVLENKEICHRSYHLVISGYELIDEEGQTLLKEIKRNNPHIKFIICADSNHTSRDWDRISHKGYRIIQKPYTIIELIETIIETFCYLEEE